MFGPNPVPPPVEVISHDHRSRYAIELKADVVRRFHECFGLEEYELVLIPGPATLAMQAVIESIGGGCSVHGPGKFSDRWRAMRAGPDLFWKVRCLLETSLSIPNPEPIPPGEGGWIIDATSGFPFYPIPTGAAIFVVSSGKQLGAAPGLAMVGVRRDVWDKLRPSGRYNYLRLDLHRGPHFATTAPVTVLAQLAVTLDPVRMQRQNERIALVSRLLADHLPPMVIEGDSSGPVVTIAKPGFDRRWPGLADRFELYPGPTAEHRYHVFTYSEPFERYEELAAAMVKAAGHDSVQ